MRERSLHACVNKPNQFTRTRAFPPPRSLPACTSLPSASVSRAQSSQDAALYLVAHNLRDAIAVSQGREEEVLAKVPAAE